MSNICVTFLGHTSVLVNDPQTSIVFDPNFSRHILQLKRLDEPVIDFERLNQVNLICLTNAHHNRCDTPSFKYFRQTAQMVMPLGMASLVKTYFNFHLNELKDGGEMPFGNWKIRAIKSRHMGFRKLGLAHTHCLHYLLVGPQKTIFYSSDTPYDGSYFFDIGKECKIDLAILPVDHVGLDSLAGRRYLSVPKALQAFLDLGATQLLPYAFGSFNFAGRSHNQVVSVLETESDKLGIKDRVRILKPGEAITI